jgi:hypothetical protein
MRIALNKGGVAHFALDVEGEWARSSTPHLLVLVDWDADDRILGVTFAGPLARIAVHDGVPAALEVAVAPEILDKITATDPGTQVVDRNELDRITKVFDDITTPALA